MLGVQVLSAVRFSFDFFRKSRFRGFRSLRSEKIAKWIGIFPKKSRDEKTGDISRNLPFSRRLARQTAVFIVRIDFDHTTWQGQKDSDPRHAVLETAALPAELYPYRSGYLPEHGHYTTSSQKKQELLEKKLTFFPSPFPLAAYARTGLDRGGKSWYPIH